MHNIYFLIISQCEPPHNFQWNEIRYLNVRNNLFQLYKASYNFLKAAAAREDRVTPVPVPPVNENFFRCKQFHMHICDKTFDISIFYQPFISTPHFIFIFAFFFQF